MTGNITYYALVAVAIVIAFFVLKKIASCLLRIIILLAIAAALAYVYFGYYQA